MVRSKRRGVPAGYTHNWKYTGHWKETKGRNGVWRGRFRATKRTRSGRGGPRPGFKIKWYIKGIQTAIKTRKGTYQTDFKFTKKKIKAGYKRH